MGIDVEDASSLEQDVALHDVMRSITGQHAVGVLDQGAHVAVSERQREKEATVARFLRESPRASPRKLGRRGAAAVSHGKTSRKGSLVMLEVLGLLLCCAWVEAVDVGVDDSRKQVQSGGWKHPIRALPGAGVDIEDASSLEQDVASHDVTLALTRSTTG